MDHDSARSLIDQVWDDDILAQLEAYIRLPNKSPLFDPEWKANGHMDAAVRQIEAWCRAQDILGLQVEVLEEPGRTPLIIAEIPGHPEAGDGCILLYGHLDKQPEMTGWRADLGPWTPVREGDKLYGRGGADDGYAVFASLTAIRALHAQKLPHARTVVLIEASEESGSPDLPYYMERLSDRIGKVELVICLDSGCGDYDHLWTTTSLRGVLVGTLTVDIINEGVHSGEASGVVPDSFRIARQLLSRLEDEHAGLIRIPSLHADIPEQRMAQAKSMAQVMGDRTWKNYPLVEGAGPVTMDSVELILNRTWRPQLTVTGADGLPSPTHAGNVLRPGTALKLSMRLPPTVDGERALHIVKDLLEHEPPYGAKVSFEGEAAAGWNAPEVAPWLDRALDKASRAYFDAPAIYRGEGGSIPFMGMLGAQFPEAQFMITGVLGPASNAHGPNEFLHIPTGKRLTGCVASVIHDHFLASR